MVRHLSELPVVRCPGCNRPMDPQERASVTAGLVDARTRPGNPSSEQQTPQALAAAYHKSEIEKWWPIIKAANIKAE